MASKKEQKENELAMLKEKITRVFTQYQERGRNPMNLPWFYDLKNEKDDKDNKKKG